MDNIIEVKDLFFEYDEYSKEKILLENFNLNIKRGSFTVILGRNGSGKSTLAKLFNGLLLPTKGSVLVDGMSTSDENSSIEIKRRVGLVFQNPDNQIVSSVVEEDVAFGPENLGIEPEEIRKRVDYSLKQLGIYDFRKSSPSRLSGGQKQRVAIAGILAMEPECIVLDEPTSMLDPKGRSEVIEAIKKLNREKNITIILITHFMEECDGADRVIVIDDGKIVKDGTPELIFSNPEFLNSTGLDIPQTTAIIHSLIKGGYKIKDGIISVDECSDAIYKLLKKE